MYTTAYLIVAVLVVTALYVGIRHFFRVLAPYRGSKIVECPETKKPVIVEVDAMHAALTTLAGSSELRLASCSRWPMKRDCGQECLARLDVASDDCLVRSVLAKWYTGKSCVYCGKQFGEVHWIDHKPALQSPDGLLVEWNKVELQSLPTVLESNLPVCWDCYIAQSFLKEHPELVVYRPWQHGHSEQRDKPQRHV
jgi:hypothetical protein